MIKKAISTRDGLFYFTLSLTQVKITFAVQLISIKLDPELKRSLF